MTLPLHDFHQSRGARFGELNGAELVTDYGDELAEYTALHGAAGVLDFSFRGRLCVVGADRVRFLHGQITNDVKRLGVGEGCYAALVTAKGKMESDINVLVLADELLLDFEPGFSATIVARLEKYIVADDVQVVDAAPHYGLLSVQGPKAGEVVHALDLFQELPTKFLSSVKFSDATRGDIYLANHARISPIASDHPQPGFDLFVPVAALAVVVEQLIAAAAALGGRACGWTAFETARVEAGIPRFGADMDETNIPLECGIEGRAVSYNKGCYIGQEVINRIHSIGHVNRELCRLRLADDLKSLPARGDKLFQAGKEVGSITSVVKSPATQANVALGYVRREANLAGSELLLRTTEGESRVCVGCVGERGESENRVPHI